MVMPVGLTGDNGKVAAGAVTHNLTDGPFRGPVLVLICPVPVRRPEGHGGMTS